MGVVFLARDVALERLVAIKLLPPAVTREATARERFLREARTAGSLAHPHVVPVHLVEVHGNLAFFVMGYVEGETLGERVRRAGPLAPSESMRVVLEVAWALGHAHANGIVHRDVKPDNILLERNTGRALVTDFGIAGALQDGTPSEGTVLGTPQYVSPEVARGGLGDARSDLYSLGVTAWYAATGRLPFDAPSASAYLLAHVHEAAPSLAAAAPRLPHRFALAIDRCLRKDPDERWTTAEDLANAVGVARAAIPMVPAPVRRFLDEWAAGSRATLAASLATAVAGLEAAVLQVLQTAQLDGDSFDIAIMKIVFVVIAAMTGGLGLAHLGELVSAARTLRREGYGHAHLASRPPETDDARTATLARAEPRRVAGRIVAGVLATAVSLGLAFGPTNTLLAVLGAAGAVVFPTFTLRSVASLMPAREKPWWLRALTGRMGAAIFRLAGIRLEAGIREAPIDGPPPTVLALGDSARELFDALPRSARELLGPGVPDLITTLERRAMEMRVHLDDPVVASRFAASVTALENVRLDLMRMGADHGASPELTDELTRVRELAAAVDRGLEAREAVERLLRPVEPHRTPA
jgi:serine/threonine-protein kinase